jgi:tight adherence protein B
VPLGLLLALFAMAVAAGGLALALTALRRRNRLIRRVESLVVSRRPSYLEEEDSRSLRMRGSPGQRAILAARLINMPLDLAHAHIVPPGWVFATAILAGIGVAWFGHWLAGWYVSTFEGMVAAFVVLRLIFGWELSRFRTKLLRQLPDAVHLVISATRAGLPISEAFHAIVQEMPSPTSDEFVRVLHEMALNRRPEDALLTLHRRTGVTEYAIFAVTIGVHARSGGQLAGTIQNLADTVRDRLAIAARARALAGEAKISAVIMGALPIAAALLLSITRPGHLDPLFYDPRGVRMFVFGVTALVLGLITMRQLIRGATRD